MKHEFYVEDRMSRNGDKAFRRFLRWRFRTSQIHLGLFEVKNKLDMEQSIPYGLKAVDGQFHRPV
jgi:hypothetical protein